MKRKSVSSSIEKGIKGITEADDFADGHERDEWLTTNRGFCLLPVYC